MPAPDGPQWYNLWQENIRKFAEGHSKFGADPDPKIVEADIKSNPDEYRERLIKARPPGDFHDWVQHSFFNPTRFPTRALQFMDRRLEHDSFIWDKNPEVRKRQRAFRRPKDAPIASDIETQHPDFMHEAMRGTGVPEHVTVYHYGDIPESAEYASGSVDPNWPEAVKEGWRSKDPSINRGRLHIYLVPHEDIMTTAGTEKEVFFRRGTPLRKTKRTTRQQKRAERNASFQYDW